MWKLWLDLRDINWLEVPPLSKPSNEHKLVPEQRAKPEVFPPKSRCFLFVRKVLFLFALVQKLMTTTIKGYKGFLFLSNSRELN